MNSPAESIEARREDAILIVGEDFKHPLKIVQELPDREIIWLLGDSSYGCPDMASLKITGTMHQWDWHSKLMEEEGRIASTDGHILQVQTGYGALPQFRLLVLNVSKDDLKGLVTQRVRNIGNLHVRGGEDLPQYEVDTRELLAAIRAAAT